MSVYLKHLLPNFIWTFSLLLVWHKLSNKKIDFKDKKLYISILGIMIISISNYLVVNKFLRIILITIVLMFFHKYLFRKNNKEAIITPIFYQLIMLISETICALILTMLFGLKENFIINNIIGIFITNLIIALISITIVQLKFVNKLYNKLLNLVDKIKNFQLVLLCFSFIIFLNIFDMIIYYKVSIEYLIVFNTLIIFIYFMIIIYFFNTQKKYNNISNKYNIAITSLNNYEQMISKYRINNHENKNLLLTIRAMIANKDKDVIKYIDSMLNKKYIDDDELMKKVSTIPIKGLRAIIYSEILKIKELGIKFDLTIDKSIKTTNLIELDENTTIDVCKIIGVFLDNSIEAVEKLRTKLININVISSGENIKILISNNYSCKNFNMQKIDTAGYTTKGNGHGYGLALVKQIVSNNKFLTKETEISKNVFSQILIIKLKKNI